MAGASGLPFAHTRLTQKFVDFKALLTDLFHSALGAGIPVLHLILDHGPTQAPKQLVPWLASLALSFAVRLSGLPTDARWGDQVEIIFSKVQRDVLPPSDFASTRALECTWHAYFADLTQPPKPLEWTYTTTKLLAKFGQPQPTQLAA